jgi:hypothetical protein
MNISYPPIHIINLPPTFEQLGRELPKAALCLLIPVELLYFSIYFKVKGHNRLYESLTFLSILAFWISPLLTPIVCGPIKSIQHFAGECIVTQVPVWGRILTFLEVAIGTMKILDIWVRRNSLPTYTAGRRPADWLFPLIVITELRYESFTPNHIRVPRHMENFNETMQLVIHILAFTLLQSLPQVFPTVLAFEVLLAIYIIWTSIQLLLRYKSSPALFGPLYLADSLSGFWSETWHNAFASPCTSLAYGPIRYTLPKYGVPIPIARSLAVLGAFGLMAIFHVYALTPIMDSAGLQRIGLFFFLNGVATVAEALVWGHKKHWFKTLMAWVFEVVVASWTAEAARIPNGLSKIPWREMCDVR